MRLFVCIALFLVRRSSVEAFQVHQLASFLSRSAWIQSHGLTQKTRFVSSTRAFDPVASSFTTLRPRPLFSAQLEDSTSANDSRGATGSESQTATREKKSRFCKARQLVRYLVEEQDCFGSPDGAREFGSACAINCVYEDRFEPQPFVGPSAITNHLLEKVAQRKGRGTVRLDKVSDGNMACGFCWTWVTNYDGDNKQQQLEGLRGTTFVELNDMGEIQYVQEIPEPLFKPGNATRDLLKFVTADAKPRQYQPYEKKSPVVANEVARYLYVDLQYADPQESLQELLRFLDDNIIYRDFNFEDVLRSPAEVQQFVQDFSFPGIDFRLLRQDDGVDSTCFTWEVVLEGVGDGDTIKGISFYELNPVTRKVVYVRDVPESAIKPPILGKLARILRPGIGVFRGVPAGSRPGGM